MIVIGITTLWVLSVIKGIPIRKIRVIGIWLLLYAIGLSQSEVMMHIGVLGGLYNRDNVISNVEGYIYILSIVLMIGYIRGLKRGSEMEREERGEGWEMEVEVVLLSVMGMVLLVWSYDLISTYLAIELQSLALYMITSRSEEGMGAISGIKWATVRVALELHYMCLRRSVLQSNCELTGEYLSTARRDHSMLAKGGSGNGYSKVASRVRIYSKVEWVIRKPESKDGYLTYVLKPILSQSSRTLFTRDSSILGVSSTLSGHQACGASKSMEGQLLSRISSTLLPVNHPVRDTISTTRWGGGSVVPGTMGRDLKRCYTTSRNLVKNSKGTNMLEPCSIGVYKRLREISKNAGKPGFKVRGLFILLTHIELWVAAYNKLASSPGSTTPGVSKQTIDGTSLRILEKLRDQVINGTYVFGKTRRKNIPKPSGGQRPLGIPDFRDRIVQEVLRSILETVYEPAFSDMSHGFRPNRSQHTALRNIRKTFRGANWFIEGDISKFFDRVNHKLLVNLIRTRVKDERFLSLISRLLTGRILEENGKLIESIIGTPQGGIISPLLSNIYLHEFDKFMEEMISVYTKGANRGRNSEYRRLYRVGGVKLARTTSRSDYKDPNFRRMGYVRYADDFVIGLIGTKDESRMVREKVANFLQDQLKLELNMDKTRITDPGKRGIPFLGYVIERPPRKIFIRNVNRGGNPKKERIFRGNSIYLKVDITKVINRLAEKGFCDRGGFPKPNFTYLAEPQTSSVRKVGMILRGLERYYNLAENKCYSIRRISYILRFSLAKMFAAKFKLGTVRKVFIKGGRDLSKRLKSGRAPTVGMTDERLEKWESQRSKRKAIRKAVKLPFVNGWEIPRPDVGVGSRKTSHMADPLRSLTWRNARGSYALGRPCAVCGTFENVEMHHVRGLKYIDKGTRIGAKMIAAMRKQIPLCRLHHLEAHGKKQRG